MKILCLGLIFLMARNAGLGLLMAACILGLLLTQVGARNIKDGNISGKQKIALGVGLGIGSLFAAILKLAVVFVACISLRTVFPGFIPWVQSVLAWVVSH